MFQMNAWYVAALATEVAPSASLARIICDERIVMFRDRDGIAHALEDRCAHRGLPLSCGKVKGEGIQCGYHGLMFNGSGTCVKVPGQATVPPNSSVRSFPLVERHGLLWIWPGDKAQADLAQIADVSYHDEQAVWPNAMDMVKLECNYMLIVDNLMDLSHIGYVHNLINADPNAHVNATTQVERADDNVKVTRLMRNTVAPAHYASAVAFPGLIDRWQQCVLVAPSIVLQETRGNEANTGIEAAEPPAGGVRLKVFHGLTPETEKSSFYFWSVAHTHRASDPAVTARLYRDIDVTIREDVDVLNKQQISLDLYPDRNYVDIEVDKPRLQGRRFVERLIKREHQSSAT